MRTLLLFIITIQSISFFGQSKKLQITKLKHQNDSLKQVIDMERSLSIDAISNKDLVIKKMTRKADSLNYSIDLEKSFHMNVLEKKDSIIKSLNHDFECLKDTLNAMGKILEGYQEEISYRTKENSSLKTNLTIKSDSIKILSQSEEYVEMDLNYSILNKKATGTMREIEDWLAQFTLIQESSVTYYDEQTARFYAPLDIKAMAEKEDIVKHFGKVRIENFIYKEGIIFNARSEFEGVVFQLFIPLLTLQDAQENIDRLCRNMGMCIHPEEMEIIYEATDFGIKVFWGGGC